MSKVLMSCDDDLYHCNGVYYAASEEKLDFYRRYLRVFDELRLVARCVEETNLSSGRVRLDSRIEYIPVPLFQGPKQYLLKYCKIGIILKNITKGCDAAILRLPSTIAMRVYDKVKESDIPYATEIVFDAHDGYLSSTSIIHRLLWKRIDNKMRKACYNANGVSCVTAHYLQQRYYTKRCDGFSTNYSSLALPKEFYGAPKTFPKGNRMKIVHVANQVQYAGRKGHNELIAAVANLKRQGIEVDVYFAGKDYFRGQSKLEELAKTLGVLDNIKFIGYINRKQLDDLLSTSDLFVLPTKAEGLPRVIIEAMAKGLPCISTNVSGNPELLGEHWLIDYSDVSTLAERIKELCTNAELYQEVSAINFHNSLEYEASVLEKRRDKFYKKLKSLIQ